MAIQQPVQTFTPNEVAELAGIAAHNVRRWAEYHAMHLSDSANPPTGMARRFTSRDIEVLKHVDSLRQRGLTVPVINEQLKELSFAEIDTTNEQPDNSIDAHQLPTLPSQTGQDSTPGAIVTLDAIRTIESEIEALKASVKEGKQSQRDYVQGVAVGFVAALLFVILLLALFALRHYL
jgi:DNA-binding transcriptional MerR regulator